MRRTIAVFYLSSMLFLLFGACGLLAQEGVAAKPAKKLVVGVLNDPPYIIKERDEEWTGLNVEIWKAIAQDLKLDYEFREETFNELIYDLKRGAIDISIEATFVTAEREKVFDYSFPIGNSRLALATLPGKVSHPWWTAVRIVLSWGTLKTVGALSLILLFLGFLLWLIERKKNPDHFGGGTISGIGSGIYWVGSTLASGVCFGVALKSLPARLLGVVWMLVCAVALSALIASLTTSLYESRTMTETVSDASLRRMRLAGVRESAEAAVFKKLGGKYVLYNGEMEAIEAVVRGEVDGFLYDEITLNYHRDNEYKDRISVYPTNSRRLAFAFGLPRESPIRKGLNYSLLKLIESPNWPYLLKRYGLEENFEQNPAAAKEFEKVRQRRGHRL
jgi:ABC-type amino acid transport substrate-binding protein